ncbi:hypothetical protein HYX14_05460, partial [Candidatus Woesearchaeota archaeon]|nr:hypothetical protein [Candidatus Woesearchaeota archaeon]
PLAEPCGYNNNGSKQLTCENGQYAPAECVDPDVCENEKTNILTLACGLNGKGTVEQFCQSGQWTSGQCTDPDVCANGTTKKESCGYNNNGLKELTCENGQYAPGECADPDICTNSTKYPESCNLNERCEMGQCVPDCQPHVSRDCDKGDVYWRNSCGTLEDIAQDCLMGEMCFSSECYMIIDDFNRPDQSGLGQNALGSPWDQIGYGGNSWNIVNNAAEGGFSASSLPLARSYIGHLSQFDLVMRLKLSLDHGMGSGGAFASVINAANAGALIAGFTVNLAVNSPDNHKIYNGSTNTNIFGNYLLAGDTYFFLRLAFDGTTVGMKIWPDGSPEPKEYLISTPAADTLPENGSLAIGGDMDGGEMGTTTVDYIIKRTQP